MTKRPRRSTGLRRLLKLAAFLDTVPDKQFDYLWWGTGVTARRAAHCGTTGCALGWAAQMPMFKELGLRLRVPRNADPIRVEDRDVPDRTIEVLPARIELKVARRVTFYGSDVGCILFDLTDEEATYLFMPNSCGNENQFTARQVATKIRQWALERLYLEGYIK